MEAMQPLFFQEKGREIMKIKYLGPSPFVNTGGFGPHYRGEVKEYPEEVGKEILTTSKKQRFELVEPAKPAKTGHNKGGDGK